MKDLNFDIYALSNPKTTEDCLAVVLETTEMLIEMKAQMVVLLDILERHRAADKRRAYDNDREE